MKQFLNLDIKQIDEESRSLKAVITDNSVDRHNEVVVISGVKFKDKLPMLFSHRQPSPFSEANPNELPIGYASAFKVFKNKIEATLTFGSDEDRINPMSEYVFNQYVFGSMNSFSIGYRILKEHLGEDGINYLDSIELFEVSAVIVPANANALVKAFYKSNLAEDSGGKSLQIESDCGNIDGMKVKDSEISEEILNLKLENAELKGKLSVLSKDEEENPPTEESPKTDDSNPKEDDSKEVPEESPQGEEEYSEVEEKLFQDSFNNQLKKRLQESQKSNE